MRILSIVIGTSVILLCLGITAWAEEPAEKPWRGYNFAYAEGVGGGILAGGGRVTDDGFMLALYGGDGGAAWLDLGYVLPVETPFGRMEGWMLVEVEGNDDDGYGGTLLSTAMWSFNEGLWGESAIQYWFDENQDESFFRFRGWATVHGSGFLPDWLGVGSWFEVEVPTKGDYSLKPGVAISVELKKLQMWAGAGPTFYPGEDSNGDTDDESDPPEYWTALKLVYCF